MFGRIIFIMSIFFIYEIFLVYVLIRKPRWYYSPAEDELVSFFKYNLWIEQNFGKRGIDTLIIIQLLITFLMLYVLISHL